MARMCPDCRIELSHLKFQFVELDSCHACAGVWFDPGEIRRLSALGEQSLLEVEAAAERHDAVLPPQKEHSSACPACGEVMYRYKYQYSSDITLESCTKCSGIWVRDGDLERMVAFMRGETGGKSDQVERVARERFGDIDKMLVGEGRLSSEKLGGLAGFLARHDKTDSS